LRNISLGYTIPASLFNDKISKFRVYFSAQNVLTFTNYSGLDPEIGTHLSPTAENSALGIDRGNFPLPQAFLGGVQITF